MQNEKKAQEATTNQELTSTQPEVNGRKVLLRLQDVKQYFPVKKTKLREKQR